MRNRDFSEIPASVGDPLAVAFALQVSALELAGVARRRRHLASALPLWKAGQPVFGGNAAVGEPCTGRKLLPANCGPGIAGDSEVCVALNGSAWFWYWPARRVWLSAGT